MGDVRQHLKAAVDATPVPAGLEARIRARLSVPVQSPFWTPGFWVPRRLIPACALLAVSAVLVTVYEKGYLPLAFGSQAEYIASVSTSLPELVKVGLGDHIHCAVFRKYPKNLPARSEFVESIGPKYAGLVRIVDQNTPPGYRMLQAHQCHYLGRGFIHITLGGGDHLISLIITPRGAGEALPALLWEGNAAPLWQGNAGKYQVSALESPGFVVYVASDLSASQNAGLLAAMAPELKTLLGKIQS